MSMNVKTVLASMMLLDARIQMAVMIAIVTKAIQGDFAR